MVCSISARGHRPSLMHSFKMAENWTIPNKSVEVFFVKLRHIESDDSSRLSSDLITIHVEDTSCLLLQTSIYVHYVVYFVACSIFNMSKTTGGYGTSAKSVRNRHLQQSDPWIVGEKNWDVMFLVGLVGILISIEKRNFVREEEDFPLNNLTITKRKKNDDDDVIQSIIIC